jgi:hypothetical protein
MMHLESEVMCRGSNELGCNWLQCVSHTIEPYIGNKNMDDGNMTLHYCVTNPSINQSILSIVQPLSVQAPVARHLTILFARRNTMPSYRPISASVFDSLPAPHSFVPTKYRCDGIGMPWTCSIAPMNWATVIVGLYRIGRRTPVIDTGYTQRSTAAAGDEEGGVNIVVGSKARVALARLPAGEVFFGAFVFADFGAAVAEGRDGLDLLGSFEGAYRRMTSISIACSTR